MILYICFKIYDAKSGDFMENENMIEYQKLWTNILEELSKSFEQEALDEIFLESKNVVKVSDNLIYVLVPSLYIQKKIMQVYIKSINKISEKLSPTPVRFKFILQSEFIEEEQKTFEKEVPTQVFQSNLNPSYNFDSFIVGPSNFFSQRNAILVANQPGGTSNPLYIFGGVGQGKTHLMQAIGNYVLDKNINSKVLFVRSQDFINEYMKACHTNNMDQFHDKYYNLDYLLMDDIQMLSNAKGTQNEFFNLFNTLISNDKQIVLTSDRPPNKLKDIVDRLQSRFQSGLIVDIKDPDLELRVKILKRKLDEQTKTTTITDDILEYIASFYNNIRDLEGGLRRVLSYSVCLNTNITMSLVKECLAPIINTKENGSDDKYDNLKSVVASYYNISVDDLISKKRTSNLVLPRHICMFLFKTKYNLPYKKIGSIIGGKDHSTVMSGCARIEQEIKTNKELKDAIDTIEKKLNL